LCQLQINEHDDDDDDDDDDIYLTDCTPRSTSTATDVWKFEGT